MQVNLHRSLQNRRRAAYYMLQRIKQQEAERLASEVKDVSEKIQGKTDYSGLKSAALAQPKKKFEIPLIISYTNRP